MNSSHKRAISFRVDNDLQPIIEKWLDVNHVNFTTLANLAIRQFVSHPQLFQSVETITASNKHVKTVVDDMIKQHADTLERLK
ncbi:hypothetical protein BH10PSE19_BH10PSE19_05770 [soil metagenome]